MARPLARATLVSALALAIISMPGVAYSAEADPDFPPLPAGATSSASMESSLPLHAPRAVSRLDAPLLAAAAANPPVSLGNDRYRCTYRDANWWSYQWEDVPGTWELDSTGRYDHYGTQDLRNTGFIGGPASASYTAEVGHALVFNGDGWVRAEVEYPWSYRGDVSLLSEFSPVPIGGGFSTASIDMRFLVDLMRDDSSSAIEVDGFNVTANRGVPGEFENVSNSGLATRTVSVTGFGEVLRSAFRVAVDLQTDTQALTNARAAFDFSSVDDQGWKTGASQDWIITMQPGYILTDCG